MTKNWEVFEKDPRAWEIPNQGVSKVGRPADEGDWEVLRWELANFVCEGEYEDGLERILSQYTGNLSRPEQAAVWVSGFFGSGKSHLVRILASLWTDQALPDGATARGIAQLPNSVTKNLKELSTVGTRGGGLWSAVGKLGSGVKESYRLAFLSVLFASAGLPPQYPAARLAMLLKAEGVYEDVVLAVEQAGKKPDVEFLNLYASPVLGQAVVNALPDFAPDQMKARDIFRAQYPTVRDISDSDTMTVMAELLRLQSEKPGEIPCTVVVLDEVQQYIGDDTEKVDNVINITELCATNFDSKVMVVATGQSALQGGGILEKMKDRFYLKVELSDRDVEQVTRSLVLRKKPQMNGALTKTLEGVSGEISKHLTSTKIGARPADAEDLVPDYPILPVRRRFWESVLRAIDRGGGSGQLRTQLRVSHDANQAVADDDLGDVVGADFIFFNQSSGMLSGKVMSQDMYQRIKAYEDGSELGNLKARVLGLVFLVSQLPRDEGADQGLRSRPETLSELLVSDLRAGSAQFQRKVEEALAALVHDGAVVDVDGEYPLQTPEGSELQRRFQDRLGQIRNDTHRMTEERDRELRLAVENAIGALRFNQGASKTTRRLSLSFGSEPPDGTGKDVPVWVRDGWAVNANEFKSLAQRAGTSDPTVFVFVPREHQDRLRDLIASYHSSDEVLGATASPDTPEGYQARAGLEARQRSSRTQLDQLVGELMASAKVWQAGGTEVAEGSILASVNKAVESSLVRKFPKFKEADHAKWGTVVDRAKEGNQNPLDVVGYQGEVEAHPVCKAILSFLGAGKKGSEVHSHFGSGDYGWPDDAINGALLTLVASDLAYAQDKAGKPTTVKDIRIPDIKGSTFLPQTVVVGASQRIAVRKLLTDCGIAASTGQELEGVARLLQSLVELSKRAGGPAPLPPNPDTALINRLQQLSGNALVSDAYAERDHLKSLYNEWLQLAQLAEPRTVQWQTIQRLLKHAAGLELAAKHEGAMAAIEQGRQLLANPDPARPILESITDELRALLQAAHRELTTATEEALTQARRLPSWTVVGESEGTSTAGRHGLNVSALGSLGSPMELVAALDATPLATWESRRDAIPTRLAAVQADLAQLAEPEVEVKRITLPRRVLKTADDIETYVDEVRQILHSSLSENAHLSV